MRKIITLSFLIIILFFVFKLNLSAAEVTLKDISSEEKDGKFMINFTFDKPTEFISYSLREPPRVILEPIDDIFTDLNDPSFQNDLVKSIKITKINIQKVVSIAIELKQDIPYHLINEKNVVLVYLAPQVEEKIKEESEEELKKMQELNKLIAPTRIPELPEPSKTYTTSPGLNPKPQVYPQPIAPQTTQEK